MQGNLDDVPAEAIHPTYRDHDAIREGKLALLALAGSLQVFFLIT